MIMNFNHRKAIRQARKVETIANEMMDVADRQLRSASNSIEASWKGEASRKFISHLYRTQTDIRTEARKLKDLARRIRSVAKIIEEAEQRAKELQRQNEIKDLGGGGERF